MRCSTIVKYGLLVARTENIGDYIQSIAAKQFLPRVDIYLDRDNLKDIKYTNDRIKVIMNGWFTDRPKKWLPSRVIEPLFLGFHISPHIAWRFLRREVIEYLKQYEPIGCRDIWTMRLLNHFGVKAYFSGCLTLTLDYKYSVPEREEKIVIIDLDPSLKRYIDLYGNIEIKELSHYIVKPVSPQIVRVMSSRIVKSARAKNSFIRYVGSLLGETLFSIIDLRRAEKMSLEMRFKMAEAIILEIASAKLVITSRLHAVLPSLAFKTPVIFVHPNPTDPRFSGYQEYIPMFCPPHRFKRCIAEIDISNPSPPPNFDRLQELKRNLIATVKNFLELGS